MANLIVLFALLFGAQEVSAVMMDSMPALLACENAHEPAQSIALIADPEFSGDGTAASLVQRFWPKTPEKQGCAYA